MASSWSNPNFKIMTFGFKVITNLNLNFNRVCFKDIGSLGGGLIQIVAVVYVINTGDYGNLRNSIEL